MNTSLALIRQIIKDLCMFKPWQSRTPFQGDYCPRVLSLGNVPLKLQYLLAYTSNWGVIEHSTIQTS